MSLRMTIEMSDGTAERLAVSEAGPVVVGRDPSCHVVLPSPDVSRRHLTIERNGGGYRLTDASANGTLVGDGHLHRTSCEAPGGIPLRVGPYVIRLDALEALEAVDGPPGRGLGAADLGPGHFAPVGLGAPAPRRSGPQRRGAPGAGAHSPPAPGGPRIHGAPAASEVHGAPGAPEMHGAPGAPEIHGPAIHGAVPQSPVPQSPVPQGAVPHGPVGAPRPRPRRAPPPPPPGAPPAPTLQPGPPEPPAMPTLPDEAPVRREASPYDVSGTAEVSVGARKRVHRMLLDHLDLASLDRHKMQDSLMRPKVRQALRSIMKEVGADLPPGTNTAQLIDEITDEALGLGPLERLLADDTVSEIMVVDPTTIYVERHGKIQSTALRFTDDEAVRAVIERIVTPLGRRIDESTPLVDARLKDGSRVNAIIKPLAIKGSCITIRKFAKTPLTMRDLIGFGSMNEAMAKFIQRSVKARKNIVISGGTGSGKTTLLNVLSGEVPENERIVTVEDAAELQLTQPHVVSLESRPANMEGRGEYTIRDLVKNALRMRPDRIIVGECRGGEALDMLQAMNTGHEGSMTTTHANSPPEAVGRLETLALMSGLDLPSRAIREQIAQSIDVIVQQTRFSDGSRRITAISEVVGMDDDEQIELHDIFAFHRTGTGSGGEVQGEFRASGYLPSFLDEFIAQGLITDGDYI